MSRWLLDHSPLRRASNARWYQRCYHNYGHTRQHQIMNSSRSYRDFGWPISRACQAAAIAYRCLKSKTKSTVKIRFLHWMSLKLWGGGADRMDRRGRRGGGGGGVGRGLSNDLLSVNKTCFRHRDSWKCDRWKIRPRDWECWPDECKEGWARWFRPTVSTSKRTAWCIGREYLQSISKAEWEISCGNTVPFLSSRRRNCFKSNYKSGIDSATSHVLVIIPILIRFGWWTVLWSVYHDVRCSS